MSEASKPTPGPWYADKAGAIWRRHPSELHENGGSVAGDKPLAVAQKGWHEPGEQGYPVAPNAKLIAEAGTVFHETGLTPRELAEQRDALIAACRKLVEWDSREKDHAIDFYARIELCDEAFTLMRAALANTERKTS